MIDCNFSRINSLFYILCQFFYSSQTKTMHYTNLFFLLGAQYSIEARRLTSRTPSRGNNMLTVYNRLRIPIRILSVMIVPVLPIANRRSQRQTGIRENRKIIR